MPLMVSETTSELMLEVLREDLDIVVWWGTEAECVGALAQKFREERFSDDEVDECLNLLGILHSNWREVLPGSEVRAMAEQLLFSHQIKTADAMQLASALLWCEGDSREAILISQDNQLRIAARREGFNVIPSREHLRQARSR